MRNWSETDLSGIDPRTLSTQEWEEFRAELRRRVAVERIEVTQRLVEAARGWLRRAGSRQRRAAQSYASSQKRPLYYGGRA